MVMAEDHRSCNRWTVRLVPAMFLVGAEDYNAGFPADAVGIRALDDYTFQMDLLDCFRTQLTR